MIVETCPAPQYTHSEGHMDLAYTSDGRFLLTTGVNQLIRRFTVGSTDQPDTIELTATGTCLTANSSYFVVGCDNGETYIYQVDESKPLALLARSSLPVRHVELSADGKLCAIASDDKVVVLSVEEPAKAVTLPALASHVSFSPDDSLICTAGLDGVIRIFSLDFNALEAQKVHEISGLVPTVANNDDERFIGVSWSPDNRHFALATKTFEISVYRRDSWLQAFRLRTDGHEEPLTAISWSPSGRYLASASNDGSCLIWDIPERKAVKKLVVKNPVNIEWDPNSNKLSVATADGSLHTHNLPVPADLPAPNGEIVQAVDAESERREAERDLKRQRQLEAELHDLGENSEAADGSDLDMDGDRAQREAKKMKLHMRMNRNTGSKSTVAPIHPGRTPFVDNKRFLNMNSVGYVWAVQQDDEHNTVTVCFFDQGVERDRHFQDSNKFDLASLTESGCLYASTSSGKVMMRFHSLAHSENWEFQVPKNDKIAAIALSDDVAIVATKLGYIRVFSIFGSPIKVYRQSRDPVVALAANDGIYMVVYAHGDHLKYSIENCLTSETLQRNESFDLAPYTQLRGLFFSENGDPCLYDSDGCLLTLANWRQAGQARWVPVFDAALNAEKEGKNAEDECYWPLGLLEQQFLCVKLKRHQEYPACPLSVTSSLPLFVPGLSVVESEYIVQTTLYHQERDRALHLSLQEEYEKRLEDWLIEIDKLVLRQLQEALHENRVSKGMKLVESLKKPESLEAAVQIALHFQMGPLAERIQRYLESRV